MSAISRIRRAWVRHMKTDYFYRPNPLDGQRYHRFKRGSRTPRETYGRKCLEGMRTMKGTHCPECWYNEHPEARRPKWYRRERYGSL